MLDVNNLEVHYRSNEGTVEAVDGASFELEQGENLGIVGESGCGKTTLAKALLGILPDNGYVNSGEINFRGTDLTEVSDQQFRNHRWNDISMIPQSAMNGLDPVYTIREQILETIHTHDPTMPSDDANELIDRMFELVGLDVGRADEYPHQFSGGMRQRAMIAMALVLEPSLVLADEPTTALDVIMQDQILSRISQIQQELQSSMIIITHDVAVVAETCDRVLVMYAGEIVEEAPVEDIFNKPYHPYTLGLKNAFPNIREADQQLVSMDGHPPELIDPPTHCRFADRCPLATEKCHLEAPEEQRKGNSRTKCHHVDKIDDELRPIADDPDTWVVDKEVQTYE